MTDIGRDIGADHIERSMRQIDHIHDSEHQRQASRHQKQHNAKLKGIQSLFEEKINCHDKIKTAEQPEAAPPNCVGSNLHLAISSVDVTMVGKDLTNDLVGHVVTVFVNFTGIDILNRVIIWPKLEGPPHRLELGRLQGITERILLAHVSTDSPYGTIEQQRRIEALTGI